MTERDEAMKKALKEALKEWLDEKWMQVTSTFGKWVLGMIAAALLAALVWMILAANGWRPPQ